MFACHLVKCFIQRCLRMRNNYSLQAAPPCTLTSIKTFETARDVRLWQAQQELQLRRRKIAPKLTI